MRSPGEPAPKPIEQLKRGLRGLLIETVCVSVLGLLLLDAGQWVAERGLPQGDVYKLTPRGPGVVVDLFLGLAVMGGLSVLYTLPRLFIRKWLARVHGALMVIVFDVTLGCMQYEKCFAVVRTPSTFVFIYPYPVTRKQVAPSDVARVEIHETGAVHGMEVVLKSYNEVLGEPHRIRCQPVHNCDGETLDVLNRLAADLRDQAALAAPESQEGSD